MQESGTILIGYSAEDDSISISSNLSQDLIEQVMAVLLASFMDDDDEPVRLHS